MPLGKIVEASGAVESYVRHYLIFLAGLGYVAPRPTGWAVLEKAMKQAEPVLYNQRKEKRAKEAANGEQGD